MSSPVYVGPDVNRGGVLIGIILTEYGLSTVFLALRMWARLSVGGTSWDDYFMMLTSVSRDQRALKFLLNQI